MSGIPTADGQAFSDAPEPSTADAATPHKIGLSDRPKRPWLLGALVCAATAAATFVLVFATTAQAPKHVSSSPIPAATGAPHLRVSATPTPTFTQLPTGCTILSSPVVAQY